MEGGFAVVSRSARVPPRVFLIPCGPAPSSTLADLESPLNPVMRELSTTAMRRHDMSSTSTAIMIDD